MWGRYALLTSDYLKIRLKQDKLSFKLNAQDNFSLYAFPNPFNSQIAFTKVVPF